MSYVSIRTATLRPNTELLFDVYIFYGDTYLPFRKSKETLDGELLERFRAKKVKKVFIPEDQEPTYLRYLDLALDQLKQADVSVTEKAGFAQDTLKQESDNITKTLESEDAYRSSEARIHKVVDFMLNEPKALAGMLASAGLSVDDSAHGSTVSSLALAVGSVSKLLDREALTDVAIAGLLHDTSLAALGFDAMSDYAKIATDKKSIYRSHPQAAADAVAGKKFITPRVLRLILDHEEYGEGLGFPEKKRYSKLAVDSQIFNLCDAFDHFSIRAGKAPGESIDAFLEARADHFDLKLLEVLEKQVKA